MCCGLGMKIFFDVFYWYYLFTKNKQIIVFLNTKVIFLESITSYFQGKPLLSSGKKLSVFLNTNIIKKKIIKKIYSSQLYDTAHTNPPHLHRPTSDTRIKICYCSKYLFQLKRNIHPDFILINNNS